MTILVGRMRAPSPRPSPVLMRTAVLTLSVLLLFGVGCTQEQSASESTEPSFQKEGRLTFLSPNGDTLRTIDIEIADTESERKTGLMRRRSLGYNRGMLFVFDAVNTNGMWMKNTPLPLDIVFLSPDSQVVDIARRTTPFSEETITPAVPRKYVVEVRAGFADRFGLSKQARAVWHRTE